MHVYTRFRGVPVFVDYAPDAGLQFIPRCPLPEARTDLGGLIQALGGPKNEGPAIIIGSNVIAATSARNIATYYHDLIGVP